MYAKAYEHKYVYGIKTANSTRNIATTVTEKLTSLKSPKSMYNFGLAMGGIRFRRKILAMMRRPSDRNAITLIAQGKPMRGVRYRIMSEKMMPPIPPAEQATPVAKARRLQNQWRQLVNV